jgi:hypothetical protein
MGSIKPQQTKLKGNIQQPVVYNWPILSTEINTDLVKSEMQRGNKSKHQGNPGNYQRLLWEPTFQYIWNLERMDKFLDTTTENWTKRILTT